MDTLDEQLDLDLFSGEVRLNPYPHYRRLRTEAPVYWSPRNGTWVISRYHDAVRMLCDPGVCHWAVGAESPRGSNHFSRILSKWMTMMDPRTHSRLRKLTAPVFTRRSLSEISTHLQRVADRILDDAERTGALDVVGDFAEPVALAAIARVIGIPDGQVAEFRRLARGLIGQLFVTVESTHSPMDNPRASELVEFLRGLLARQGEKPANTLVAAMCEVQREDDTLDDDEILAFLILFLFAGQENMMNFIGNAAYALIESPRQLELLREDAALLPAAIEELLRFESPVQFMTVSVMDDVSLRGATIPCEDPVLICIGSANRDDERFTDPEQLDITRSDKGHLSFGHGPLKCIGATLARLEGRVLIGSLAQRIHRPTIRGPLRLRRNPPVLRGFESLVLAFDGEPHE